MSNSKPYSDEKITVEHQLVKLMVDTETKAFNTGPFPYKGKNYELVAEIREMPE